MDTNSPNATQGCTVEAFIPVIAGKWKILILWRLFDADRRFNELRHLLPGVTQKMLTQQLRELETDGIVRREVFAQVPPKVVYSLTPLGRSLHPILRSVAQWSREHMADVSRARQVVASSA